MAKQKNPTKKIARLLAQHLKLAEKAKALFQRSGAALDHAVSIGALRDDPITLRDGRQVRVIDQFATTNHAFSAKMFNRFIVKDHTMPRPAKRAAAPAATESEVPA